MIDVFLDTRLGDEQIRITDAGLTLMKLSYNFEIDTPNKSRLLERSVKENGISLHDGELFLDSDLAKLPSDFLHFTQAISRVSSLQVLRRHTVSSLFYEELNTFVRTSLLEFGPQAQATPLKERPELEVDFIFPTLTRPVYLFGVKDSSKARLSVISCLEFKQADINFRSLIVHENVDNLQKKDQRILMNTADKQFASLADFESAGQQYLMRELAA